MPELGPYEGVKLNPVPPPPTVAVGGWWRTRWHLRSVGDPLGSFPIPPPWGDVDATSLFISCWWGSDDELVVDAFSRSKEISGELLSCVSMIVAWFEYKSGAGRVIEVDGLRGHPLMRLSQIESGYIEEMEALGY